MQSADAHRWATQLDARGDGHGVRLVQVVRRNGGVHGEYEALELFASAVGQLNVHAATAGSEKGGKIVIVVRTAVDGDTDGGRIVCRIILTLPQGAVRDGWDPGRRSWSYQLLRLMRIPGCTGFRRMWMKLLGSWAYAVGNVARTVK